MENQITDLVKEVRVTRLKVRNSAAALVDTYIQVTNPLLYETDAWAHESQIDPHQDIMNFKKMQSTVEEFIAHSWKLVDESHQHLHVITQAIAKLNDIETT